MTAFDRQRVIEDAALCADGRRWPLRAASRERRGKVVSAAVVQEFCCGGKVELFPDEDWPTQILAAEEEVLPAKFTELNGWLGCWRFWWSLARQLGGSVRAGEDGKGRYFVQFLPGGYRDLV